MTSDYQFVSTDTSALTASLISAYETITGVTVRPASPERLFILWVADIIVQTRALINYAANQNIPSRASGENLDALGELFYGTERPAAKAATCTMRFYISEAQSSSILIPAGTRVTDTSSTLYWETTEDVYVAIGDTYADVSAECQTAGTAGNGYAAGQINTLVDVFSYYSSCENITESANGSDEATDEEYYELLRASMDAISTAGAQGGYIYWAKTVSTEIADVIANSPEAGYVNIYVLMSDGSIAGEETKAAVLEVCNADDVRPLTDYVSVEDPDTVSYDIAFTYYISSATTRSASDIEADVETAAEDYKTWQSGKLGRDINPSKLVSLVMAVDGVKRVDVESPTFTELETGSSGAAPSVAAVGSTTITNGGYEDE
ncbi:MAG: baseplate J/gp47 family protein [Oscillospiraceae bacterium]|nr:baseplate J/gp47 family protein [Oscillospiraceae bacterium]